MAYSEELASGIRQALAPRADVMEKKMFACWPAICAAAWSATC